jgi:2-phospho-L-lactate guanylyltransferase
MTRTGTDGAPQVWAIVPVKQLSRAKQRLSVVLSAQERIALVRAMLHDVLATLSATPELNGILVVTGDTAVARLAAQFDAAVVGDVMEAGVNAAVQHGLRAPQVSDAGVLIVPADIPFATPADLQSVLSGLRDAHVVLAPASSDGGTNALAMRRRDLIAPSFGNDSFVRHQALARSAGLACDVVRLEGLGQDIDGPCDLVIPGTARPSSQTAQFLLELKVAKRLPDAVLSAGRQA